MEGTGMIIAKVGERPLELRWHGDAWRDKAGHVWVMDKDANLTCGRHGKISAQQWSIVSNDAGDAQGGEK
jgi:hypothetical protein